MPTDLVSASATSIDTKAIVAVTAWLDTWLASLKPATAAAYRRDLVAFASFHKMTSATEVIAALLGSDHPTATDAVDRYKAYLVDAGFAPSTINRRLSSVRSLVNRAHERGRITWQLSTKGVKAKAYRDTAGPGIAAVRKIVSSLDADTPRATRNRALVRLLFDLGLRRGEAVALDLADLDLERCKVMVIGKGYSEREPITIPDPTCDALRDWIAHRGAEPGPLFTNFDRARKGERLTGRSVGRIIAAAGEAAEVGHVRPHGIRHSAITHALDISNGNTREVQKFSRHAMAETVNRYDDNRIDLAGQIAAQLADTI